MTLRRVVSNGALLILTAFAVEIGESAVSTLSAQTISSAANQSFYVGAVSTTASTITITDPNSKITPGKDIHIYFPAALALDWDNTVTTLTLAGSAAGKVSATPIYSANGDSVRINVTAPWLAGDQLIISNLAFRNFTAVSGPDTPRMSTGSTTNIKDDKTKQILPAATISSAANQTFIVGDPATAISTITITAQTAVIITAASDIRVRIPAGFNMTWNTGITTATVGGGAAAKVSTTVSYENGGQVLVLNVTTNFAAGDSITVAGLQFTSFTAVSAANNLQLVAAGGAAGATTSSDDKTVTVIAKVYGVSVSPHSTTASRLPRNGTNYTVAFTVSNTGNGYTSYDLLTSKRPGTVLTTVSITGTGVTQGGNPDSARLANVLAGNPIVATVTYSVGNVTAGLIDTLVFKARAVGSAATIDTGKLAVTVVRPSLSVVKAVNPSGTLSPGTNLTYTITLTNSGTENAVSVVHVDSLPSQVGFKVSSVSTTLPLGVSGTVAYSSNGGSTWTYVPVSTGCSAPVGYDYCVRDIRLSLSNRAQQRRGRTTRRSSSLWPA
jgi:uncharacterized repeat protein (TIGR01451 family)